MQEVGCIIMMRVWWNVMDVIVWLSVGWVALFVDFGGQSKFLENGCP